MLHHSQMVSSLRRIMYGFYCRPHLGTVLAARGYVASPSTRRRHLVATLRPDRLLSAGQKILNLSGGFARRVYFEGAHVYSESTTKPSASVHIPFYHISRGKSAERFPPDTKGVFYYSEDSQIRFRLCDSVDDFGRGIDLQRPDGLTWNIPFARMVENPLKYGDVLSLLKKETSVQIDPSRDCHRTVSTFSPDRLMSSSHRIVDISGYGAISILPGSEEGFVPLNYVQSSKKGREAHVSFPPNTKGVFYYHQAKTAPTRVGELRFRLCADSRAFEEGNDLCLPSGDPWFVGSHSLSTSKVYRSIRNHLIKEQLLDNDSYTGIPESILASSNNPVLELGQPFVVELSRQTARLGLLFRRPHWNLQKLGINNFLHNVRRPPSFSGRAIVSLEQYPTALHQGPGRTPLFAMQFLEAMSPIKRIALDGHMLEPVPGDFLTVAHAGSGYVPWGFSPTNANKRQVVMDWIEQQSSQPVPPSDR